MEKPKTWKAIATVIMLRSRQTPINLKAFLKFKVFAIQFRFRFLHFLAFCGTEGFEC
jgi:hypothetical protein